MAFLGQFRDTSALRSVRQGGATTGAAKTTLALSSLNHAAEAHSARHPVAALQRMADHYTAPLQRMEEDEDIGQMKAIRRMEEEEDLGQLKAIQRMADEEPQQHMLVQRAEAGPTSAITGGGLPGGLRSGIESLSGLSMRMSKSTAIPTPPPRSAHMPMRKAATSTWPRDRTGTWRMRPGTWSSRRRAA